MVTKTAFRRYYDPGPQILGRVVPDDGVQGGHHLLDRYDVTPRGGSYGSPSRAANRLLGRQFPARRDDMDTFRVERKGPKGPDSAQHTFCVVAVANKEAVRQQWSGITAAISGASSSDGKTAREAAERFCAELNRVFTCYMRGEFHEKPIAELPVCIDGDSIPAQG